MFERDVHASNADHSISTNPSFSSTSFNAEHPLNNPSYLISIFLGTSNNPKEAIKISLK